MTSMAKHQDVECQDIDARNKPPYPCKNYLHLSLQCQVQTMSRPAVAICGRHAALPKIKSGLKRLPANALTAHTYRHGWAWSRPSAFSLLRSYAGKPGTAARRHTPRLARPDKRFRQNAAPSAAFGLRT